MPRAVLCTLHVITHSTLMTVLDRYYYDSYFTDKETEAQ